MKGRSPPPWEIILQLLVSSKKKLRLQIADTVLLKWANGQQLEIAGWYLTSKKGDVMKRREKDLTLQNVCDRFSRIALSGCKDATPRIVAIAHVESPDMRTMMHLTCEQLQREVKSKHQTSQLKHCTSLPCYIKSNEEDLNCFKAVYTSQIQHSRDTEDAQHEVSKDVTVYGMQSTTSGIEIDLDGKASQRLGDDSSALLKWIQKEVDVLTTKIVQCLESNIISKGMVKDSSLLIDDCILKNLSAYFVLDSQNKLWLKYVDRVDIHEGAMDDHAFEKYFSPGSVNFLPSIEKEGSPRMKVDRSKSIRKVTRTNSKAKELENIKNDKLDKPEVQDLNEGRDDEDEYGQHSDEMDMKITKLRNDLEEKTKSKDDHAFQVQKIRKEATESLQSEENSSVAREIKTKTMSQPRDDGNDYKLLPSLDTNALEKEVAKSPSNVDRHLSESKGFEEIGIKRHGKSDRDKIVEKLYHQCNSLSKRLQDELFDKNEARRRMEARLKESSKALDNAKAKIMLLETDLENEKEVNEKSANQLKTTNKVLTAELETQREYVKELKTASWTELNSSIKQGVEHLISQELTKSSMGVAHAVATCEEQWKKRIEELSTQHLREVTSLKDDHKNELRYKMSQLQIQFEQGRVEIEERLQQKHNESLRASLNHKERQKMLEIKNEVKRWEQMMSEMRARLSTEYQQSKQRLLKEKEMEWTTKLEHEIGKLQLALQDANVQSREEIKAIKRENQENLDLKLKQADDQKGKEVASLLETTEKKWADTLKRKEIELKEMYEDQKVELQNKNDQELEKIQMEVERQKKEVSKLKDESKDMEKKLSDQVMALQQELKHEQERVEGLTTEIELKNENLVQERLQSEMTEIQTKHDHDVELLHSKYTKRIEQLKIDADKEREDEIENVQQQLQSEFEQTMEEMEKEHEEELQTLEYEASWLKQQKGTLEKELKESRDNLNKHEKTISELEEHMSIDRVESSHHKWFLIVKSMKILKQMENMKQLHEQKTTDIHSDHDATVEQLETKIKALEKRNTTLDSKLKLISKTILNHKRDALVEHKTESRKIASRINDIAKKLDTSESKRRHLSSDLESLMQAMHEIERQLHEHSQTSALQGGKLNISHTRRKRRLDEEYEQILFKTERKQDDMNTLEDEIKNLLLEKSKANDEMRSLEKGLVSLLIEQQKSLLSIASRGDNIERKS